jgi:hypothetical protein
MIRKSHDVVKETLTNKISSKIKVKVFKSEPDSLRSLYGEPVQSDAEGNEYFVVPAHLSDYTSRVFPKYTVGDEFLPDNDLEKLAKTETKSITEEKVEAEKKKRGNTNWGKKKIHTENDEDAADENG